MPDSPHVQIGSNAVVENATEPALVDHLDHVGILVRDIEAALGYYLHDLGFRVEHDEVLNQIGVRLVYLTTGNPSSATIQLLQPIGLGAIADDLEKSGEGFHHLCFTTPDISKLVAALDDEEKTVIFVGGRNRRACFLRRRPNGVLLEVIEEHSLDREGSV